MAKAKKKRADKYDTKLAIEGSFDDVIGVSVKPDEKKDKAKPGPKAKEKK
jgi:hypothetical protein